MRFDPGPVVLRGRFPEFEGASAVYSPRRTLLDKLLVDAARDAGAEVRERFAFDELVFDGDRVTGIRGRSGGGAVTETARLVVGADGRHSAVAKAVRAPAYHVKPALSTAYYTYWSGVELAGGEIYGRAALRPAAGRRVADERRAVMTYVAAPASEFNAFRADPEGAILAALDSCGDLGERVRAGERAERVFGTADTQNRFHRPYGPGWALVGDAGLVMDPVTGAGIADALRDAELLADAVAAGLNGGPPLDEALAGYQAARDAAALPMYEMTIDLASFAPPRPEQQMLMRALEGNQAEIDRFLSVLTGSLPARSTSPRATCCGSSACAGSGRRCARRGRCAHERAGRNAHRRRLVRAAQAGDTAGLGALLERHRSRLHAIAVSMLGHGPQAEDAVQDAFLIALRRIGELRDPAAARAWLVAILVNVCRGAAAPARRPVDRPSTPWDPPGPDTAAAGDRRRRAARLGVDRARAPLRAAAPRGHAALLHGRELLRGDRGASAAFPSAPSAAA